MFLYTSLWCLTSAWPWQQFEKSECEQSLCQQHGATAINLIANSSSEAITLPGSSKPQLRPSGAGFARTASAAGTSPPSLFGLCLWSRQAISSNAPAIQTCFVVSKVRAVYYRWALWSRRTLQIFNHAKNNQRVTYIQRHKVSYESKKKGSLWFLEFLKLSWHSLYK